MADAPKRKKLEKTSEAMPATSQKFYCCRCGNSFSRKKGYFPVSHSPMYRGSGYLPFCSDCINDMYEEYCRELGDKEAMRRMCMKLDLYWNESIYEMAERSSGTNSRIRNYIGKTNMVRFIDKTFDDTLREEAKKVQESVPCQAYPVIQQDEEKYAEQEEIDPEVIDFWGAGYSPDFYAELERRYKGWTEEIPTISPPERSLYRQICLLETIISRDAAQGKSIDKNVNALNTLLGSMNLKPAQKKSEADSELEKMPLGVGIQKWEYSRPLPETPKGKKDVRGTIKNITTWYLGHACKMVGLRNSYTKMYEDAMDELRVKHPEYDEEDDDTVLNDIFGSPKTGGDV